MVNVTDVEIELQALITEREGMIAENQQREHLGNSMAYDDDSFLTIANKMRKLRAI